MINSEDLINKVKSYNKFLNPETLTKAYDFNIHGWIWTLNSKPMFLWKTILK